MKHLLDLFAGVADRVAPPVLIVLGSPWPTTQLVAALGDQSVTCFQMDLFTADRLRDKLRQESLSAEVVTAGDLWDLPNRYRTILYPAAAYSDRELKLDMIEQGFHLLEDGGQFIALSEYEKDSLFAKAMKNVFGKCGETPTSRMGMAFWSVKKGEKPRRRHEMNYHAKIGDGASMNLVSRPGTFSYGRMDAGARAMLEVAQAATKPGHRILDLGCGNGAVGCLASTWCGPTGHITFVDSNTRATKLTELNAKANSLPSYDIITSATMEGVPLGSYDAVLANPPYYANSEVAQLFITMSRDLLKPNGVFYLVTKMPVQTIPEVVETFREVESVENRGYTIVIARG